MHRTHHLFCQSLRLAPHPPFKPPAQPASTIRPSTINLRALSDADVKREVYVIKIVPRFQMLLPSSPLSSWEIALDNSALPSLSHRLLDDLKVSSSVSDIVMTTVKPCLASHATVYPGGCDQCFVWKAVPPRKLRPAFGRPSRILLCQRLRST